MRNYQKNSYKEEETRINISHANELEYFTYKWKISQSLLKEAIKKSGSNAVIAVENYLRSRDLV